MDLYQHLLGLGLSRGKAQYIASAPKSFKHLMLNGLPKETIRRIWDNDSNAYNGSKSFILPYDPNISAKLEHQLHVHPKLQTYVATTSHKRDDLRSTHTMTLIYWRKRRQNNCVRNETNL